MFGFYRFASVCPNLKVADTAFNTAEIIRCGKLAQDEGAAVTVFPELCITGYSCSDLFHQELLLKNAYMSLQKIAEAFADTDMIVAVGLPLRMFGRLYNCAAFVQRGNLIAVTPKIHLPNQREFYEKRHFNSGRDLLNSADRITWDFPGFGDVPVTNFIRSGSEICFGVELCEDLWTPVPPSGELALAGANVILNLSASDALVGKGDYRRNLVMNQSARCMAAYVYSSAGVQESTTDMVFSGHLMIAENGSMLAERKDYSRDSEIIYADVDVQRLNMQRLSEGSFQDFDATPYFATAAEFGPLPDVKELNRFICSTPFVPGNIDARDANCREIFNIQCAGLAKRMEASHSKRAVVGLSGGLDSTLALLVIAETFKLMNRPASEILVLTMPGFGTTNRTKNNAVEMANLLGVELRTVSIKDACMQHFSDIGHDPEVLNVTYENVQARERTQILMDVANKEGGIVVGTGDLSEIALGWSTYNADHMSMYAVNCDIPKTLVRHVVAWYADRARSFIADEKTADELSFVLRDILDTPVSPELLPADANGQIAQKTESILGAYEIHDFYLYHFAKYGAEPAKLLYLAKHAFAGSYPDEELERCLKLFVRRFFTQQFKRSCIPDGPKVGTISLSPRADWRMPSDASFTDWLEN
ncbi:MULTISPECIES: NAD(+) synthase [unclassified Fibrobacter]|uniref:NAD(+) synthase n=1 Tax=unclassified Fibrobacter TaxID=2634177 RepID=UPI000D6B3013|nr:MULTISPECIES: NAD(+) synthase [unclassified Fibrobacter]PWJ61725.1 NAD+ synthase (glutamine-hydrolysing) [Fibrobacter sp. UWR4]PZW67381.1 NAD+ synthase (glutamine-hydrolysing) [Fibrobacter sp. UWR1]